MQDVGGWNVEGHKSPDGLELLIAHGDSTHLIQSVHLQLLRTERTGGGEFIRFFVRLHALKLTMLKDIFLQA